MLKINIMFLKTALKRKLKHIQIIKVVVSAFNVASTCSAFSLLILCRAYGRKVNVT